MKSVPSLIIMRIESTLTYLLFNRSTGRHVLSEQPGGNYAEPPSSRHLAARQADAFTRQRLLRIDSVRASDAGVYQCSATGPHDTAQALTLVTLGGKDLSLAIDNQMVTYIVSYNILLGYLDNWSGFEAAKTAPWPSQGLHHFGKFLELSLE